jgi:hypothetical protein
VYLVLAVVLVTASGFATIALGAILPDDSEPLAYLLLTSGPLLIAIAPILAGAALMNWPKDPRSSDSRTYVVRYAIVCGGLGALGLTAVIAVCVIAGAPVWIPIGALALLVFLFAACSAAGEAIRRRIAMRPLPEPTNWGLSPADYRRRNKWMIIAFVIGTATPVISLAVLSALFNAGGTVNYQAVLISLEFGLIGAAIPSFPLQLKVNRMLQAAVGDDLTLRSRLQRTVLRGKTENLSGDERARAARWASVLMSSYPVFATLFIPLYAAIFLMQANFLFDPSPRFGFLAPIGCAAVLVAVVVSAIVMPRQYRRAKNYVESNRELLNETDAPSTLN